MKLIIGGGRSIIYQCNNVDGRRASFFFTINQQIILRYVATKIVHYFQSDWNSVVGNIVQQLILKVSNDVGTALHYLSPENGVKEKRGGKDGPVHLFKKSKAGCRCIRPTAHICTQRKTKKHTFY